MMMRIATVRRYLSGSGRRGKEAPTTNLGAALGDAAWMTSLERNSDLIVMASYAPLFVNVDPGAMQWESDLIGYDALNSYGFPSYYAQAIFAEYLGDGACGNPGWPRLPIGSSIPLPVIRRRGSYT